MIRTASFEQLKQFVGQPLQWRGSDVDPVAITDEHSRVLVFATDDEPLSDKLRPHMGHNIVMAMYGDVNIAIECEECGEVLYDVDAPVREAVYCNGHWFPVISEENGIVVVESITGQAQWLSKNFTQDEGRRKEIPEEEFTEMVANQRRQAEEYRRQRTVESVDNRCPKCGKVLTTRRARFKHSCGN